MINISTKLLPIQSKRHQNRWRLGLRPDPAGGACIAPPDPLAVMGLDRNSMTPLDSAIAPN